MFNKQVVPQMVQDFLKKFKIRHQLNAKISE